MVKEDINSLDELLNIMYKATKNSTNYVFAAYSSDGRNRYKPIYNLFGESFIGVRSFSLLMMNQGWSQAAAVLRTLLEQVSSLFVISFYPEVIDEYLRFDTLRRNYYHLESKEDKKAFLKQHNLNSNNKAINDFLDYGWIRSLTVDGVYGRDQLLTIAQLSEFIPDIKGIFNKFIHGQMTIFDFHSKKYGWTLMSRYGKRMVLICAKLFDFLVCSYAKWANEEMVDATTARLFKPFKVRYRSILAIVNQKRSNP